MKGCLRMKAARYSTIEVLRDGRRLEIRALRPEDKHELLHAVSRTGAQSLFRRFFAAKRTFSEQEIAFFVNVDFSTPVALLAGLEEQGAPAIVGGGRYI